MKHLSQKEGEEKDDKKKVSEEEEEEDVDRSMSVWDALRSVEVAVGSDADVREAFDAFDVDGDGSISAEELGKVAVFLGRSMEQVPTLQGVVRIVQVVLVKVAVMAKLPLFGLPGSASRDVEGG